MPENLSNLSRRSFVNLGLYPTDVFPGIEDLALGSNLSEWNVEEITALEPDVVIAASQAPEDAAQQLRDLGIPVVHRVTARRGKAGRVPVTPTRRCRCCNSRLPKVFTMATNIVKQAGELSPTCAMFGSPYQIRTGDLRLERAMS